MSSLEALRACFFPILVVLACLSRSYFRNCNGPQAETIVWEDEKEQKVEDAPADVASSQPAMAVPMQREPSRLPQLTVMDQHLVEKLSASFEDSLPTSIDSNFHQKFQVFGKQALPPLDGEYSGDNTPVSWPVHFPAAQLRPY